MKYCCWWYQDNRFKYHACPLMAQGNCLNLFLVDNWYKIHFKVCQYYIDILFMYQNQRSIFYILIIDVIIKHYWSVFSRASLFFHPRQTVRLLWGSKSIINTSFPFQAKMMTTFSVVVVLPTPSFWLATAMTLHLDIIKFDNLNQVLFDKKTPFP